MSLSWRDTFPTWGRWHEPCIPMGETRKGVLEAVNEED
jgi:hypothetical protein